jgi:hypothetical protein
MVVYLIAVDAELDFLACRPWPLLGHFDRTLAADRFALRPGTGRIKHGFLA